MSVNSFEEFSERLGELPLHTPPVQLLVDAQRKVYRRRKQRQQLTQLGIVAVMFMLTVWVVVDQTTFSNPELMLAETEVVEPNTSENQGQLRATDSLDLPTDALAASAIVLSVVAIDKKLEQLSHDDVSRSELLAARNALKRDYISVRNRDKISLFQKASNVH